jgi:hypothetical protein
VNKETGEVILHFDTFDSFCMGYYEFILEEFETDTEGSCEEIVLGHSYVAKNKCNAEASYHSERKGHIKGHQENEAYPQCEKVTVLLYIDYG